LEEQVGTEGLCCMLTVNSQRAGCIAGFPRQADVVVESLYRLYVQGFAALRKV
jgi:hypothetical protein